jgi:hypothetical protein
MAVNWLAVNLEARTLSMRSTDGRTLEMPMPPDMFSGEVNLRRVEVDVATARLVISMAGEPTAVVELHRPGVNVADLVAGRSTIYLDQNHWSTLAAVRHGERPARRDEIEPARRLMELVDAERVLLPVSAGHLVETTPLHGPRRVALAGAVLALGRGWQMRNPLHVRVEEMTRALSGSSRIAVNVFAPGADGFFGSQPAAAQGQKSSRDATTKELLRGTLEAATTVLGLYDAIIDEEAIADEGRRAHAAAEAWAAKFGGIARRMREADEPVSMVRRVAHANLQADMVDDIIRASSAARITPKEAIDRLNVAEDPIARMPFLAQMRQMLYARMRNAGQRWEANDLVDMMFLCCAAGYADLVVGERRAIGYLRQARQPPPRAQTATSLREALELLAEG